MLFLFSFYQRNFPVKGVKCVQETQLHQIDKIILDLSDYNNPSVHPSVTTLHIPYAYLNRFYKEIPKKPVHVVAGDQFDLHLGIRFLKKKGYDVSSYTLNHQSKRRSLFDSKVQKCGGH